MKIVTPRRRVETAFARYIEPAVGVCDHCGSRVHLADPLDNFCACGCCYNMAGQRVIPSTDLTDDGYPIDPCYDA